MPCQKVNYDVFFKKASQERTLMINDFKEAFRKSNVIITPVAPNPAFLIGEKIDDPLTMYLSDIFTLSPNLAGIPCMSIPYGMSSRGLPIGVQILGDYFDDNPPANSLCAGEDIRYLRLQANDLGFEKEMDFFP